MPSQGEDVCGETCLPTISARQGLFFSWLWLPQWGKSAQMQQVDPPFRNPRGSFWRLPSLSWSFYYPAPFSLAGLCGEASAARPHCLRGTPAPLRRRGLVLSHGRGAARGMCAQMRGGQPLVPCSLKKHFSPLQRVDLTSLVGQKVGLGFFHKMRQGNPNELFGQPK